MESLDKSLWSIKSIWRVGWRLPLSRRIVRNSKGELYLSDCKWLHFHCNLCISFYPVLPSFPIPHCIFKGLPYSRVPRTRACGVLCVRIGRRYKVYHARVSCIVKKWPSERAALWWSFRYCHRVSLDKWDILLFLLSSHHQHGNYHQFGRCIRLWQRVFFQMWAHCPRHKQASPLSLPSFSLTFSTERASGLLFKKDRKKDVVAKLENWKDVDEEGCRLGFQ